MVWLLSLIMAMSMTACSNTEKKSTKEQTITQSTKEQTTKQEKTTAKDKTTQKKKKEKKKKEKKKDQKKTNKKTAKSTAKNNKSKSSTTTKTAKNTKIKSTTTKSTKAKETTTAKHEQSTTQASKNETVEEKKEQHCEFLISCKTVLSHKDDLQSNYNVPAGGKIYEKTMKFEEGDTVMDVLKRTGVELDISKGYVAGIDGLYEFDCGRNSGWMYRVNGKFPNYMAGKCKLSDGDKVEWLYTCVRGDL